MNQGWSFKKLDKLIVTSATYRQASRVTSETARSRSRQCPPGARARASVWRPSRFATGLSRRPVCCPSKIGGPSVFPPQPASITTEGAYGALKWTASRGADRYRRSIYTFAKRTAPFALYNTFDAPSGEVCIARREVSNSPLQALSLLNDTLILEAAQAVGKSIADESEPDAGARIAIVSAASSCARPTATNSRLLLEYAASQREHFGRAPRDAAKVAGGADGDLIERATWDGGRPRRDEPG